MMHWSFFATALGAALVTWTVMPTVGRFAQRIGAIDKPVWRSSHKQPTPRLGGLGIAMGASVGIVGLLLTRYIGADSPDSASPLAFRSVAPSAWLGALVGGWMIFIMGLLDDISAMKAKRKLAVQVVGTAIIAATGCSITGIGLGSLTLPLGLLGIPVAAFWLLSSINAVNLMDGVDGLVGGLSTITFATCAVVSACTGNWALASVACIWAAACAGYLPHNWNPASIFMGDCGSQLLGVLQGVIVLLTFQNAQGTLSLVCALLMLLIPIGDMARVIVCRLLKGQPIFNADRGHLHHVLLDAKLKPRQICGVLWSAHALTALLAAVWFLV